MYQWFHFKIDYYILERLRMFLDMYYVPHMVFGLKSTNKIFRCGGQTLIEMSIIYIKFFNIKNETLCMNSIYIQIIPLFVDMIFESQNLLYHWQTNLIYQTNSIYLLYIVYVDVTFSEI